MKKQKLGKKLSLKTSKISNLSMQAEIIGGRTLTCNFCLITDEKTCQIVPLTEAHRCTHTIGNGQDGNGNPCTY